jgi:ubiquinone/menaquinone biosynthesis C-methylase UbiE
MAKNGYKNMWEDFAEAKSSRYLDYKFQPTYRVGLTNYLREELVYKLLNLRKTDVVLDTGCASGRQLFKITDRIKEGYGIDISTGFIKEAENYKVKNNINNLFFQAASLERLPFTNNFFDKIICAEILEHVFNKNTALKELIRVLKQGGFLVVTVPNLNADATWWGRFLRLLRIRKFRPLENFSEQALNEHGDAHVREFDKSSLVNWLRDNKLKVLDVKSVSFIDGPYFDFLLKFPLHINFFQKIIIYLEKFLTNLNLYFGRHLVIKLRKK